MLIFLIDLTWLMVLAPALGFIIWAKWRLRSAGVRASVEQAPEGLTGAEFAAMVLESGGVEGLKVVRADGPMANFYDPGSQSLRLSGPVFDGRDMARLGRAAYEAGHAVRDGRAGRLGRVRRVLAFASGLAATAAWLTMLAGLVLTFLKLFLMGTALLWVALAAALAEVPLGRGAARCALALIGERPSLSVGQKGAVGLVLTAAPWSRVASLIRP